MAQATFPTGVVHDTPADLRKALMSSAVALTAWESITPLARNEFICWVEDAKRPETRAKRIDVALSKLEDGERRPCCWIGCIHRTDKAISPSVQGILSRRKKK
ncbi:MAG: YdeI/OmpD-associated family protein [Candidatus Altimarinota bacterium]